MTSATCCLITVPRYSRSGLESVRCLFRERVALRPDDRVRLRFDPNRILYFDEETGHRI